MTFVGENMPSILSDPPPILYIVIGVALAVTGAIAAQRQDRKSALPFLVVLAIGLVVFAVDRLVESPREESVRHVQGMAAAADSNQPDEFVKHLADTFTYHSESQSHTLKREAFKAEPFWHTLRQMNVHVAVWNFSRDDVKVIDDNTVEIGFMAKGEVRGDMAKQFPLYARATFKRQSDGQLKMTEFRTFDPLDHKKPLTIPQFVK